MVAARLGLAGALLCLALGVLAVGQESPALSSSTQSQSTYRAAGAIPTTLAPDLSEPAAPDSYVLGAGDLVDVFVFQMPDLTRQLRLNTEGDIRLPLTSAPIHAGGLTAPAVASAVRQQLLVDGIARDPEVEVVVRQVESKSVVVSGAVKNPVTLELVRPLSLVEVLSRAGGLAADAGDSVIVSVRQADGGVTTRTFATARLVGGTDLADNPLLTGGEVFVRVPPALYVYSVGAVARPGAFPVSGSAKLSVLRALALSGGLKEHADPSRAVILSALGSGPRHEVPVDLTSILKHKAADVQLEAGDVLYVPINTRNQVLAQLGLYAAQAATIAIGYRIGR